MKDILRYFPNKIKNVLEIELENKDKILEEIRIRAGKPIILKFTLEEKVIKYIVNREEILNILQLICENSIYSYQHQIAEGYITISGGHRVGISGSCVLENEKIININYINSLNFRIARQVKGCSKNVLQYILKKEGNTIYNTLIVSPPGAGKTTLLKDIVKQISDGIDEFNFKGITVGVVDERGEIAALYKGISQNDIGIKTDVIDNASKDTGIKMLVRAMAPKVVVADEIGKETDIDAINYAISSGVKGIFSAHGNSFEDLKKNNILKCLIDNFIFETIIILDLKEKGKLKNVYLLNKNEMRYEKQGFCV